MIRKVLRSLLSPTKGPDRHAWDFHSAKINESQFLQIEAKYRDADPDPGFSKYLDPKQYLNVALGHYKMVGIAAKPKAAILDIGTGAGYFPFVCANLGHDVQAMDVVQNDFYREMTLLLGLRRCEHRIEPFQELPRLSQKFDYITAFAICFNCHATDRLWGPKEWDYFINDLRTHHANPGCVLFLKLNREPNGEFYTDELREFFKGQQAEITNDVVRVALA